MLKIIKEGTSFKYINCTEEIKNKLYKTATEPKLEQKEPGIEKSQKRTENCSD